MDNSGHLEVVHFAGAMKIFQTWLKEILANRRRSPDLIETGRRTQILNKESAVSLYKCLATTNVIETPQSGSARRTGNVTPWRDPEIG
jgi:hypothetical protein